MKHIFIIDPFKSLIPRHDSSLAIMNAALLQKDSVWIAEIQDIAWQSGSVRISARPVSLEKEQLVAGVSWQDIYLQKDSSTVVWMRKDPAVDEFYIRACQILRLAQVPTINNPNSLIACDEKLLPLEFPQLIPDTFVSQNIKHIRGLIETYRTMVAKPIGQKGGEGIFVLEEEDRNLPSIIEWITNFGQRKIILQKYLPKVRQGDKRIFLLAGDPLGAILRVPAPYEHRANMAKGACVLKTQLSQGEIEICRVLKPRLLELGLYIVGLDVIDEKLTEINMTSPTGLEEIAQLDGTHPAIAIIQWADSFDFYSY